MTYSECGVPAHEAMRNRDLKQACRISERVLNLPSARVIPNRRWIATVFKTDKSPRCTLPVVNGTEPMPFRAFSIHLLRHRSWRS